MNTKRLLRLTPLFALALALLLSGCVATAPAVLDDALLPGQTQDDTAIKLLEFDVAEDITRFSYDQDKVFDDGLATAGASFITHGYIYPEGTLNGTEAAVNEDGSPLYPDKVIGEWICYGWFVGDGLHTTSGPVAVSTQVYQFGEEYGGLTLVSDGYELADTDRSVQRAIVGGTGEYATARGEVIQTNMGMTEYFGVNLRFSIELHR